MLCLKTLVSPLNCLERDFFPLFEAHVFVTKIIVLDHIRKPTASQKL